MFDKNVFYENSIHVLKVVLFIELIEKSNFNFFGEKFEKSDGHY